MKTQFFINHSSLFVFTPIITTRPSQSILLLQHLSLMPKDNAYTLHMKILCTKQTHNRQVCSNHIRDIQATFLVSSAQNLSRQSVHMTVLYRNLMSLAHIRMSNLHIHRSLHHFFMKLLMSPKGNYCCRYFEDLWVRRSSISQQVLTSITHHDLSPIHNLNLHSLLTRGQLTKVMR
jgi:hypothetical protein